MPYVPKEDRERLLRKPTLCKTPGELNFVITTIVQAFLFRDTAKPNYARYNEAIGALECAKLELYRRQIVPYEDEKCTENGDVY
jgi:hypothetical protein